MTQTLIIGMILFFAQPGLGQNEWPSNLLHKSLADGKFTNSILPLKDQDPVKKTEAIQEFNQKGRKIQNRNVEIYQLDSTIQRIHDFSGGFEKKARKFYYDKNGMTKTSTLTSITPDGDTIGNFREEFLYNDLLKVSQFDWWSDYPSLDTSIHIIRLLYTYNSSHLLESCLELYYDGSAELQPGDSIIYTYNPQGLPEQVLYHQWEDSISTWVEYYKEEFTYTPLKSWCPIKLQEKMTLPLRGFIIQSMIIITHRD